MLYGVNPTDISILTHKFSPTAEKNGFKQTGRVTSLKYGTLVSDTEPDQNLGSWFSHFTSKIFGHGSSGGAVHTTIVPIGSMPSTPKPADVVTTMPVSPKPSSGYVSTQPVLTPSASRGVVRADTINVSGQQIVGSPTVISPNLGDDMMLGSMFSHAISSVSHAVSNVVQKAAPVITKVATKVATGGITLVTDTGVLGAGAKKLGQRADVVAAGAIGGGVAGLLTGGVPGLFAGAVAGGTKGVVDATSTGNPSSINTFRTLYQGAAYGAAAGGVARAINAGISSYQQAQMADSAAKAEQAGYGAAADTAHSVTDASAAAQDYGAAGSTAHEATDAAAASQDYGEASSTAQTASAATKSAASGLLGSSIKNVAEIAGLKMLLGGGGNPLVLPGTSEGAAAPVYVPGSGSQPGAFSPFPMSTNTSLPASDGGLTPIPGAVTPATTIFGMPPLVVYGAAAITVFMLIKRRRAA